MSSEPRSAGRVILLLLALVAIFAIVTGARWIYDLVS